MAGDLLSFASDVAGAFIRNVVAYIRYVPLNTKIVNTVVDLGTSLELLSDTNIINKQNNDILIYDSTSSRWINKPSGFTPSYWWTYSITSGIVNVQPSAPVNWNGVNLAYRVFDNVTATNMIIENKDISVFEVLDSGYVMNIKKSGYYWVNIKANNNSGQDSTFIIYWSTTSPTSGYSIFEVAPYTNVINSVLSHSTIWEITQPCYIMFALLSNQWTFYNIISFEKMISDEVVINNTTTNYLNPPLNQISKFYM